jgi:hypothetical protein
MIPGARAGRQGAPVVVVGGRCWADRKGKMARAEKGKEDVASGGSWSKSKSKKKGLEDDRYLVFSFGLLLDIWSIGIGRLWKPTRRILRFLLTPKSRLWMF